MDRTRPPRVEHHPAMCAGARVALELLLRAEGRDDREPGADAADRRTVHADAVERVGHQSEAGPTADAGDGIGGPLSEAAAVGPGTGPSDLSLPAPRPGGHAPQSRCGRPILPTFGCGRGFSTWWRFWIGGHTTGRAPCRSSVVGHPDAKYFWGYRSNEAKKEKRSKKERKPVETVAAMEIRTERGFPQRLGKASSFSTVPTRQQTGISLTGLSRGPIHLKPADFLSEEWGAPPDALLVLRHGAGLQTSDFSTDALDDLLRASLTLGVSALDRYLHERVVKRVVRSLRESELRPSQEKLSIKCPSENSSNVELCLA